ncbi:pyruvate, water dikinase regulatory protein [Paenibacillus sacheonensis]|uniref:Putative pyruvate, phosphate dikinase regulatory protein n=1 Tax=Paenibacillus sacheonensis TaxID=742054 RepID=A0A7X4YTH1_9BACL|nr:pyruvate, water dikinase regulatory protein [Paenibacillus sacheonensis]MBM7565660.1 regulator of PEP synthase PpsR (kinase-PPPase family) [Paenibacillus sacheonensis]NBC72282.1 kinase/pyrophosphorylase [Paenibacillus sacheonensis]
MAADAQPEVIIYVVSDSAGDTGELVVRAAVAQFHPIHTDIRRAPFVHDEASLERFVRLAKEHDAIMLYTLVLPGMRERMIEFADKHGVTAIDLLGSLIKSLELKTDRKARQEPGLNHVLDENYFRKVEAVEFAVKYDDMRDTTGILKADIVLVGVSRTSKTPLSMYLAHKQFKVANVPLIPEVGPPPELFQIPKEKVVGLTIDVRYLNGIRKERLKALGLPDSASYAKAERIEFELQYASSIMDRLGCLVIDVSHKAVEETASLILEHIESV